jgi:hypothetical protein
MSTTTVAELKSVLGIGSLYSDAVIQSVCDAADNVLLPFIWNNKSFNIASESTTTLATLYFDQNIEDIFYVGQTVVVSNNAAHLNGSKTITAVSGETISYTISHGSALAYHPVNPYGTVAATETLDPATVAAIQEASLMVCVSIWTARQTNSGNGMQPDGSMGSMYTMSSQLVARVRGLLAPYLDPRSMVG